MANSLVKIDVHLVFHIKSRGTLMRKDDLPRVFQYIGGTIRAMNGIPFEVGGVCDHIHILASVPKTMALMDFVRNIKANSSRWIKQIDPYYARFCWQDGYGAFSVSPSLLERTVRYIQGQEEHHKKRTFEEEYKLFLERYGIQYDERYLFD